MEWLKERWETFKEAAGIRRHLLGYSVTAIIGLLGWFSSQILGFFGIPEKGDQEMFGIPIWLLAISVFSVLVAYWLLEHAVKLRREVKDLTTPKFHVERNNNDFGPVQLSESEGGDFSESTQYRIRIVNDTAILIKNVEVYCESCEILGNTAPDFLLIFGGGRYPQNIAPHGKLHVGIVRTIIEKLYDGVIEGRRIEIQIPSRPHKANIHGKEFSIAVTIEADNAVPVHKNYRFGDRNGEFYFEEVS